MKFNSDMIIRSAMVAAIGGVMLAQTPAVINVADHRPMAGALDAIEQAFGLAINYEDVPYENSADLEDVSTPQQRAAQPGYRLMVPRKGTLSITLTGVTSQSDLWVGVNGLLNDYRTNKLPGDFTIEQANGMLYVIPTKKLTKAGSTQAVTSPMAVPVTIP